jgi:hypothetical protein
MWDLEDGCYPTCSELRGSLTYRMFDHCLFRINAYFRRWARIGYLAWTYLQESPRKIIGISLRTEGNEMNLCRCGL